MSEEIVWEVVGENVFNGKASVQQNCEQTADYFNSVQTDFITGEVLVSDQKVIVMGTAEFKRDGKRVSFISACDIYEFNKNNEIIKLLPIAFRKRSNKS